MTSPDAFEVFTGPLLAEEAIVELSASVGWETEQLAERLALSVGEAAQTLKLIDGIDIEHKGRLLEVGAGLGVAASFLASQGLDVVALEPSGAGFEEHALLAGAVRGFLGSNHEVIDVGAELLNERDHGVFDVIYSNNVIEHIAEPDRAFGAMAAVLAIDGVMVHSCPNYSVPFEPHFGIPLVPGRPRSTRRVLPSSISDSDVWSSLNFIRARDVERLFGQYGLRVAFREGALAASVHRLGTDAEFRSRHRALGRIADVLTKFGAVAALRRLPAAWSTPMDFIVFSDPAVADGLGDWLDCRLDPVQRSS